MKHEYKTIVTWRNGLTQTYHHFTEKESENLIKVLMAHGYKLEGKLFPETVETLKGGE